MFILQSEVEHALNTHDIRYLDRIIHLSETADRDNLLEIVKTFGSELQTINLEYTRLKSKLDDRESELYDMQSTLDDAANHVSNAIYDVIDDLRDKYDLSNNISVNEMVDILQNLSKIIEGDLVA